jgi:hypothetical protein
MSLGATTAAADGLERACLAWETEGNSEPLRRWLTQELTDAGCPRRLRIETWGPSLRRLFGAEGRRAGVIEIERARWQGWVARLVHLSRGDGSMMFGPRGRDRDRTAALRESAARTSDAGLAAVVDRWFADGGTGPVSPLVAARSEPDLVLAALRGDWNVDGDFLAIDHRDPSTPARIEVAGDGRPWISGDWPTDARVAALKPTHWTTGAYADTLEWSFRDGGTRITRTAVSLRYRKVALLAQQEDGPATSGLRLTLGDGTSASPIADQRSLGLLRGRAKARLIPLGLPALPYETDKGSLTVDGKTAVLSSPGGGRRRWLPVLLAWGKPPSRWRTCTVTEKSEICGPDVAFGARIAWGAGEDGLLIYRSLGPPALRVVLGHQTRARFLIGRFTYEGNVIPLVTLD